MRTPAKNARAWGKQPIRPFKGDRCEALGLPYSLLNAASMGVHNALYLHLPNGVGIGLPYVVHHENDPRGVVSTFEFEDGERYEVIVQKAPPRGYPEGCENAADLKAKMEL